MELSQFWGSDEINRIMPVLAELSQEGSIESAGEWPALRTEVVTKLGSCGISGPSLEELIRPLDDAVSRGSDFKSLVTEMVGSYTPAPVPQVSSPDEDDDAFTASLPDAEELATQIVMDLGPDIAQLIASHPEFAEASDADLIQWIVEDVSAALDEIGTYGLEQLG